LIGKKSFKIMYLHLIAWFAARPAGQLLTQPRSLRPVEYCNAASPLRRMDKDDDQ